MKGRKNGEKEGQPKNHQIRRIYDEREPQNGNWLQINIKPKAEKGFENYEVPVSCLIAYQDPETQKSVILAAEHNLTNKTKNVEISKGWQIIRKGFETLRN